ncbi:myeloid protein 1-like [Hydractinia symbiolongicarpus]|uniref:myeloid protein 1-like n=1 Tax=Hydractinia symbiolongicarpus TaxID=13093 RepID=UPI00254F9F0C|nr:myeloid protein 1-like [Hydractinia symbiolongicarpus]
MKIFSFLFALASVSAVSSLCLNAICSSNPSNTIRGCDTQGCGHHGASRRGGTRKHNGIDVVCTPGSSVYAPFSGTIVRRTRPYATGGSYNNGLVLRGSGSWKGFEARIWYFTPKRTSGSMTAGENLGPYQKLPYRGITQHVHLQLKKNGRSVNPASYVC